MASGMRTPREIAHELANRYDRSCLDHEVLGWSHGPRCNEATEAIEAYRAKLLDSAIERIVSWLSDEALHDRRNADVLLWVRDKVSAEFADEPAAASPSCQRCGKTGGRVVSTKFGSGIISCWKCPHCAAGAPAAEDARPAPDAPPLCNAIEPTGAIGDDGGPARCSRKPHPEGTMHEGNGLDWYDAPAGTTTKGGV